MSRRLHRPAVPVAPVSTGSGSARAAVLSEPDERVAALPTTPLTVPAPVAGGLSAGRLASRQTDPEASSLPPDVATAIVDALTGALLASFRRAPIATVK